MGKSKKRKKKPRNPPLSVLDKCIYIAIGAIGTAGASALIFLSDFVPERLAAQDAQVIAAFGANGAVLFQLPFGAFVFLSALIFAAMGIDMREPIFGKRSIRYGMPPWARDCYPLLGPQRRKMPERPSAVAFRRKVFALWCAGFLLTACLVPLSMFSRVCLREDHSIVTYNLVNAQRDKVYTTHDYETLTIAAGVPTRSGQSYWLTLTTEDGKKYQFDLRAFSFRDDVTEEDVLREMLALKARFSREQIEIEGTKYLPGVVKGRHLTEAETALLYELFGVTPPA